MHPNDEDGCGEDERPVLEIVLALPGFPRPDERGFGAGHEGVVPGKEVADDAKQRDEKSDIPRPASPPSSELLESTGEGEGWLGVRDSFLRHEVAQSTGKPEFRKRTSREGRNGGATTVYIAASQRSHSPAINDDAAIAQRCHTS